MAQLQHLATWRRYDTAVWSAWRGHQLAEIKRLWCRCVAKPAFLYAHLWPVQAYTVPDQQLSASTTTVFA